MASGFPKQESVRFMNDPGRTGCAKTRIPQWESDAVSEEQTLRNEDNAFLPLSSGQISLLCEFCQSNKVLCQAAEKTLKQHPWVSSPLQVRPSLMFNCGIRAEVILLQLPARTMHE